MTETQRRPEILTGDLSRVVFRLALPVLMQQALVFCVGFFDTWLSGRIDAEATEAIGVATYVNWLASLVFTLVSVGTTAIVARHWGAGEYRDANRVTQCAVGLAGFVGGLSSLGLYALAPVFAELLNAEGEMAVVLIRYLRASAFMYPLHCVTLAGSAGLRGSGDMRTPMLILGLVSILNMIVSPLCVFMTDLGVHGIVVGTVTARSIGGLLMLAVLSRGINGLKLDWSTRWVNREIVRRMLRIGIPAGIDGVVMWSGHFAFLMIIARLAHGHSESAIFAAHVIGIQIEAITYLPASAWGSAAATVIGQSLGAKNHERAFRAGNVATRQCCLLGILVTAVFFFGAETIYTVMHTDQAVRDAGIPAFRMLALFQIPLMILQVYLSSLHGAGDTRFPMFVTIVGVGGVRLPAAWYFGVHCGGGLFGAWIGMCADMLLRSVLLAIRYHRRKWLATAV